MTACLEMNAVTKAFTLHNQGGVTISVMSNANLRVGPGECVALVGPSGAGKSTVMRMAYGNYLADDGEIWIGDVCLNRASPREILMLRRQTLGYVSQFLRVVPRVATTDVVAEPLLALGVEPRQAHARATELLRMLNIPERLWPLSPMTFSGGEQQRVNIARGFIHAYPVLLLDEPTASLDAENRAVVLSLIEQARDRGAAILGIFHDEAARQQVCTGEIDVSEFL